jgi:mannose-6-phosphate isomerase-like protein (cupin superfamily)
MSDYTAKRIDDMEAIYGGSFKRARAELGASTFGMQVIDMPPNAEMYPEHDHGEDGMEEIYVVLRGAGDIEVDGERVPIDSETIVRVGPGTKRKIWPGDQGIRILALGGTLGKTYEPNPFTELGEPDPMAS